MIMKTVTNDDPTTCLDPAVRVQAMTQLAEFGETAAWLQEIADDLAESPSAFRDVDYARAAAVDLELGIERLRELETVVRSMIKQWLDLRKLVGECPPRIKRRRHQV